MLAWLVFANVCYSLGNNNSLVTFTKIILMLPCRVQKSVKNQLEKCVKVEKQVIWHYVLRRDLGVLNAPALRRLWFQRRQCAAPEREGP